MLRLHCNLRGLVLVGLTFATSTATLADEMVQGDRMLVIAGHPEATRLGLQTMSRGGNAIDALVTVSLALGVAEPGNSGLGGKIVCLYYDAKSHDTSAFAAMNAAPSQVPLDQVLQVASDARQRGWIATCTPGLAAALGEAHGRWGTRSWKDDVEPAVKLATDGVVLGPRMGEMLSQYQPQIDAAARAIYAPTGKTLTQGDTLRNPDLAHTMQLMADQGYREFYEGETAHKLAEAAHSGGGFISLDDLKHYHARFLEPLHGNYRGYTVLSSPPPLSGGATLLSALECIEHNPLTGMQPRDAKEIDLVGRIMEQVYPEVAAASADFPESMVDTYKILDARNEQAMYDRALTSDPKHPTTQSAAAGTSPRAEAPADDEPVQGSTTHLIIIDRVGDIVCCTQSLGIHFGAAVVAPGTGFLVNADLNNFALNTPTSKNYIAPGKWARSTMTPTIVFKDSKPILAIGSPASQRIPTAVMQVMIDVLDFHRPLEQAIRAPRFHIRHVISKADHVNDIDIEQQSDPGLDAVLTTDGWSVHRRNDNDFYFGSVNAAQIEPDGSIIGVADQRRTSDAGGE